MQIVHMLDYKKINNSILSILNDSRFDKKCKRVFKNTMDLLISYSDDDENCISELQALKVNGIK